MAEQKGIFLLKGRIDNVTRYCGDGVFSTTTMSSVGKSIIANDPALARMRENKSDIGRVGKNGRVLRKAFPYVLDGADFPTVSRLDKAMLLGLREGKNSGNGSGESAVIAY